MNIADIFEETFSAITINKARSGLTVLGIVIGIGSVIAMIAIGQGASSTIQSSIEGLGSNLLTVTPGFLQPGRGFVSAGRGSAQTLKNDDTDVLRAIPGVAHVSPEFQRRFQIVSPAGRNTNSTVIGISSDYADVRNVLVSEGTFVTDAHVRGMGRVAVLGPTAAQDLFGENNSALGKSIRINKVNFTVVGILQAKGSAGFFNPDDTVFVPLSTMQKILAGADFLSTIAVSVESKERMAEVQAQAATALVRKHHVDAQSPDFSIVSQADILGTLTQVTNTFTIFLASIAGISLVVGGIGIMNMMLTALTERTREIGLRKAIGARRSDIGMQFLAESVMLTFFGGIAGVLLGWCVAFAVRQIAGISTAVSLSSILLAFGVSATIGIVFGYYPARRAAGLNPIDALRYE